MVSILSLFAIVGGVFLRFYLAEEFVGSEEDAAELKEIAQYLIIGGVVVILINSWIIKPIMMALGG